MPDTPRLLCAVLLLLGAAALTVVAVTALTERLPRNRWAGVRTPTTMASPDAFRLANRVAAVPMLAAAAASVLAAVAALTLHGSLAVVVALLAVAAATAMVVAGGLLGVKAAARCAPERCADCTGCELMDSLR